MRATLIIALIVAVCSALLLLGEKENLPPYATLKAEFSADQSTGYDLVDFESPRLTGGLLKAFSYICTLPVVGRVISRVLSNDNKLIEVRKLASFLPDTPLYYPYVYPTPEQSAKESELDLVAFRDGNLNVKRSKDTPFRHWSIGEYTSHYSSGDVTPLQVARALIAAVDQSDQGEHPLRVLVERLDDDILAQARASTERYALGESLGPLDGVPVVVKDELDVKGYHSYVGTSFIGDETGIADEDSVPVARLRAAGAIIAGKTNMHEIGAGVTGYNMHYGVARNPHNPLYHTGGSSSGSAVAVASGLVPLAVGLDGGGSIRIPAGMCGVVGIKPTFQRVPPVYPDCPSVCHAGPIAGNVRDTALAYAILSGGDEAFPPSLTQPPVDLSSFEKTKSLSGVKVGYFPEYSNHSAPEVASSMDAVLKQLQAQGAEIVETPLESLNPIHIAHMITITAEMSQSMDKYFDWFGKLSPEVSTEMSFGRSFTAIDLLASNRVRAFALRQMQEKVFSKVDVFVTPTTGVTAPEIPLDAIEAGELNAKLLGQIFRFCVYGNLVGIPGISVPVTYDSNGLPISIQFQANHWNEDTIFRVAHLTEKLNAQGQKQPQVYFSLLEDAKQQPRD